MHQNKITICLGVPYGLRSRLVTLKGWWPHQKSNGTYTTGWFWRTCQIKSLVFLLIAELILKLVRVARIELALQESKTRRLPLSYTLIVLADSRGVEPHPISENPVFKAGRRTNAAALLSIIGGDSRIWTHEPFRVACFLDKCHKPDSTISPLNNRIRFCFLTIKVFFNCWKNPKTGAGRENRTLN
jgi:hypothetical protein